MTSTSARPAMRLLLLMALAGCAQPRVATAQSTQQDSARRYVRALLEQQRLPGLAVTITVAGRIVWHEGFGYADVAAKVPASPETLFRIGSVSKLLTAAALMRLVESGTVDLDAPISTYVNVPAALARVTLRQLAGHTAGVRHYGGNEFLSTQHHESMQSALGVFINDTLLAQPGTRYSYSCMQPDRRGHRECHEAAVSGRDRSPCAEAAGNEANGAGQQRCHQWPCSHVQFEQSKYE